MTCHTDNERDQAEPTNRAAGASLKPVTTTARPLPSRRLVLAASALASGMALPRARAQTARRNIKLGFDNFAVRAFKWKASALIDFAAHNRLDSLFITDLDAFESRDSGHLRELRKRAEAENVQIHLGTWSVCPTSTTFKKDWGNADEHLALGLRMASDLGSPVLRVILGNSQDRLTPGGIEARIRDMVKVLRRARKRAKDAGIKIAVENHAGDMRSHELVSLVERAGKDFVGVNIDPGNAVWALEDPLHHLEILGPYTLTSSMRDSNVWVSEKGVTVQWTAMGDGVIDFVSYMDRFATLCPGVPVHIETISGFNREFPLFEPGFWQAYKDVSGEALARLWRLARNGKPNPGWKAPAGEEQARAEQAYQKDQLLRSLHHCKEKLGLGLKT